MSASTIAQKVDTQARVIRSLNLIHCADTQHMVGAVELERLLNLEIENLKLKQRIKLLEEAGDALLWYFCPKDTGHISFPQSEAIRQWNKAKEAKP